VSVAVSLHSERGALPTQPVSSNSVSRWSISV
jgi:hypothetical protein